MFSFSFTSKLKLGPFRKGTFILSSTNSANTSKVTVSETFSSILNIEFTLRLSGKGSYNLIATTPSRRFSYCIFKPVVDVSSLKLSKNSEKYDSLSSLFLRFSD